MRWFFQDSVSDCLKPRFCSLFLCILPSHSRFPNPCHIHHTGLFAHLGIPCLRPSISDCQTGSLSHLGVTCLRPSKPITHPDFLSLPVAVLLHAYLPTAPPPPCSFLRVFQCDPKLFFRCLLAAPHLHSPPPSFIPCLPCTYLK